MKLLLLVLLISVSLAHADEIEVLQLQNRSINEVLPVLQPLLEPGGTLTGMDDQLILRASAKNRAQIKAVLARIDQAPRQLVIYVRQHMDQQQQNRGINVNGRVGVGGVSVTVPNHQRPSARLSDGGVNLDVQNSQHNSQEAADQMVRVIDGGAAYINAGVSVPMVMQSIQYGVNGAIVSTATVYQDLGSGFYATPRLTGERVTLDISPQQTSVQAGQYGNRNVQRLTTTVQTRLGEWVQIGGTDSNNTQSTGQLLGTGSESQQSQRGVWLKVEVAD
ncbi:secretin N-terminal domain-containing protein [Sulfuriferula nivalis]|uniref:Secretin n=1 Tax=Sulfuriferula nivalis TaxID=2675298 RepID=A0A809RIH9_9PROT|nr:secretin N-terminal domain-containing protein [Sulfuriferula nivalis]BBP01719.1 secretin [Sulfuriferula nivalis]